MGWSPVNAQGQPFVQQRDLTTQALQDYLNGRLSDQPGMYRGGDAISGLAPDFARALYDAALAYEAETGQRALFNEVYRPPEVQAQYYANYVGRPVEYGGRSYAPERQGGIAAPPGRSAHQSGRAADIPRGPFLDWMTANAGRYGLAFPVRGDPVHVQMGSGSRQDAARGGVQAAAQPAARPAGSPAQRGLFGLGQALARVPGMMVAPLAPRAGVALMGAGARAVGGMAPQGRPAAAAPSVPATPGGMTYSTGPGGTSYQTGSGTWSWSNPATNQGGGEWVPPTTYSFTPSGGGGLGAAVASFFGR